MKCFCSNLDDEGIHPPLFPSAQLTVEDLAFAMPHSTQVLALVYGRHSHLRFKNRHPGTFSTNHISGISRTVTREPKSILYEHTCCLGSHFYILCS